MNGDVLHRRYLCLWLPFLSSDRWRRKAAAGDEQPLVFLEKDKGVSLLSAVDQHAHSIGLRAGMAAADARARVPELRAVEADPSADAAFIEHLADLALAFTPSVALDAPNGLALDITGCTHLFAGEAGLTARLQSVLRTAGVSLAKLAVAPTPDMARALARFCRASPCFAADDELVRALPVEALECSPENTMVLKRAGLRSIADVASRPSLLFTSRFTSDFTIKLGRVLGEEDRRISPLRKPAPYRAERRCAEPVISENVITGILTELTTAVCEQLSARGEGGRVFACKFLRTDGASRRIEVETSRPMREPTVILRLYSDRLEELSDPLDPGFGFDLISFEAVRAEPWQESRHSLDAREEEKEKIAGLVDRLSAMFGRDCVLRLQPADSHIPERAQAVVPAVLGPAKDWPPHSHAGEANVRPPLIYAHPRPIDVDADEYDTPTGFRWRRVPHRIMQATGPERIAEEWWRPPLGYGTRDYYHVESSEGRRFWIFRASATTAAEQQKWFLHGLFP